MTDVLLGGLDATTRSVSPVGEAELWSREGHDPAFLGTDVSLPLPTAGPGQIWLPYTHFSVLMDVGLRQARLTVVDIDGALWRSIERGSGTWCPDPRLRSDEQPEAAFFQKPDPALDLAHNRFGFGHMVRRQDPCWEEPSRPGVAVQAERETFHLTNASPQVEGLNLGTWQVLEDVVLDDVRRLGIRVVVLTGPVFAKDDPLLHGQFRIPRAFWKIVAWRSGGLLAAAGWRQAQPAEDLPAGLETVNLPFDGRAGRAWLLPIAEIEGLTGLDLAAYVGVDTYGLRLGGAEAARSRSLPSDASTLLLSDVLPLDDTLPATLGKSSKELAGLAAALADREAVSGDIGDEVRSGAEAIGGAPVDAAARVSLRAYDLIVQHETGGRAYYEKVYKSHPVWPKGASGITIGFGYDLGYVTAEQFARDWASLPRGAATALAAAIGRHGGNAGAADMQALLATVRDIPIGWADAEAVFRAVTLPRFAASTDRKLPNCEMLSGDCFGALVSLTFNRGGSYTADGERYKEMRAIFDAMSERQFGRIPGLLRDMVRVWVGSDIEAEMRRRRTDEAALFEAGLAGPSETVTGADMPERPTPNSGDDADVAPTGGAEGVTSGAEAAIRWRVARSLDRLLAQVNATAPHRNRASDGAIGDAAHAKRNSDHNPWVKDGSTGVVTARDFTHDPEGGCDAGKLAEAILASRDPRVKYLIWNRRITAGVEGPHPWTWRPYDGKNAHTRHVHVSVLSDRARFDSEVDWQIVSSMS